MECVCDGYYVVLHLSSLFDDCLLQVTLFCPFYGSFVDLMNPQMHSMLIPAWCRFREGGSYTLGSSC